MNEAAVRPRPARRLIERHHSLPDEGRRGITPELPASLSCNCYAYNIFVRVTMLRIAYWRRPSALPKPNLSVLQHAPPEDFPPLFFLHPFFLPLFVLREEEVGDGQQFVFDAPNPWDESASPRQSGIELRQSIRNRNFSC